MANLRFLAASSEIGKELPECWPEGFGDISSVLVLGGGVTENLRLRVLNRGLSGHGKLYHGALKEQGEKGTGHQYKPVSCTG